MGDDNTDIGVRGRRPKVTTKSNKPSAGISRRLNRDSGKWLAAAFNSALADAMIKALRPSRKAAKR